MQNKEHSNSAYSARPTLLLFSKYYFMQGRGHVLERLMVMYYVGYGYL